MKTVHEYFEIAESSATTLAGQSAHKLLYSFRSLIDDQVYTHMQIMAFIDGRAYLVTYTAPVVENYNDEYLCPLSKK